MTVEVKVEEKLMNVPYGKSVHGKEEIDAVVSVLKGSTQMGKNVMEMEERVSNLFAKKYGLMVNSGSSANYLAVEILNLPKGSEVITPALTFSTTVAPLVKNGLIPVFIDVEPDTYNIDVEKIESQITENTKAMMIPNLLGNLPDWEKLSVLKKKYNLILIEDSCDTLGATQKNFNPSNFSDITTTSFYGSHVINCAGNGGMLCVNDEDLFVKAKLLRSWGRSSSLYSDSESIENRFNVDVDGVSYDNKFIFQALGYNLEPSEMGAAFGLVQLDKLQTNISLREKWFDLHMKFFSKYKDFFILPKQLESSRTGWLAFPLIVKDGTPFTRTQLQIFLERRKIQTRVVFSGNILRHDGFKNILHKVDPAGVENTDRVMRGGMLLGCHHGLTIDMVNYMHSAVDKFFEQINSDI